MTAFLAILAAPAVACDVPFDSWVVPGDGAVDVPTDAIIFFQVWDDLGLYELDGTAVPARVALTYLSTGWWYAAALVPEEPLEPNRVYQVIGGDFTSTFQVGDGPAGDPPAPPRVTDTDCRSLFSYSTCDEDDHDVVTVSHDGGLLIADLGDAELDPDDPLSAQGVYASHTDTFVTLATRRARDLRFGTIDQVGRWSGWSEPLHLEKGRCEELEPTDEGVPPSDSPTTRAPAATAGASRTRRSCSSRSRCSGGGETTQAGADDRFAHPMPR